LEDSHSKRSSFRGSGHKFQREQGTAEEKIPSTIQDIAAWPIRGLVVFDGDGFTPNMRSFLIASGKAVEFDDLREWLVLYFGLPEALSPISTRQR
jgi:hypothetical protein